MSLVPFDKGPCAQAYQTLHKLESWFSLGKAIRAMVCVVSHQSDQVSSSLCCQVPEGGFTSQAAEMFEGLLLAFF